QLHDRQSGVSRQGLQVPFATRVICIDDEQNVGVVCTGVGVPEAVLREVSREDDEPSHWRSNSLYTATYCSVDVLRKNRLWTFSSPRLRYSSSSDSLFKRR